MAAIIRVGLLVVVSVFFSAGFSVRAFADRKSHATMVIDFIDKYFLQRVDVLDQATARLSSSVDQFCADPSATERRKAMEDSFKATVLAWGAVDFVRLGPAADASRAERFLFWPDPRGTTARQMIGLLAKRDPAVTAPGGLKVQSAAVQGLTALELLLYEPSMQIGGSDDVAQYRCAFASAIGRSLHDISTEIISGWSGDDGFRAKMISPGSDNALYKDASETARDVVGAFVTGVELALNRFVTPELTAANVKPPKRVHVPFERSGLSMAFLRAQVSSLNVLFDVTGLAGYIPADKPWMEKFLPTAFNGLGADIEGYEQTRAAEPGSDERLAVLRKMRFDFNGLRQIVVKELAPNAELTLGFNALDGD